MLPDVEPMLATSGWPAGDLADWAASVKFDGWRARIAVDGDQMVVRSRRGRSLTACVPELGPLTGRGLRVVLDGELIVGQGRLEDFRRIASRLAGTSRPGAERVTFAAFDVVVHDGQLVTSMPFEERQVLLNALGIDDVVTVVPTFPGEDAGALLGACGAAGMEGVVLKRRNSRYLAGKRSTMWRKVRCGSWSETVAGRQPG